MPDADQVPTAASPVDVVEEQQKDIDEEAPEPAISIPDSGDTGEGGKLRMIVGLLKKALGVKDIAAMRLSLPASLLEPIPNLEYWCYLDRLLEDLTGWGLKVTTMMQVRNRFQQRRR